VNKSCPKVIVAVLHSSREDALARTLDSIYKQEYPDFSVLVVDTGATEQLAARLQSQFPQLRYVKARSAGGVASGKKLAVDQALALDGEFVFLTDNDIELDRFCLARLMDTLLRVPRAGVAAPILFHENGGVLSAGGIYLRLLGQPILKKSLPAETRAVDFVTGAIGLYRKAALQKTGPFDSLFDPYGFEDIDHGLRLKNRGYSLHMVAGARGRHISSYSFHEETGFFLYHTTKNRLLCAYKHVPRGFFFLTFLPWFGCRRMVVPVAKFFLMGKFSLASEVIRGVKDGMSCLASIHKNP